MVPEKFEDVLDKILMQLHQDQNRNFLIAMSMHVVTVFGLLLIRSHDMTTLLTRIEGRPAANNTNQVHVQRERTAADLAFEILKKDGKVD